MSITEFLLARIAEDEAQAARSKADAATGKTLGVPPEWMTGVADRVLAECEAKRRIVEDCYVADCIEDDLAVVMEQQRAAPYVGERILRQLALPYADHPDYDPEWRP